MNINLYSIAKKENDDYSKIANDLSKMIKKFAKIDDKTIFTKEISKAQTISDMQAKKSYTNAYEPFLQNSYNIALDVEGKHLNSFEFSNILDHSNINFFIGGAYGFEDDFLKRCDKKISLSTLTFSHKIAKIVLLEQIFRGLCIKNNHPYHK
jgi:23S rRNA (pseudouridine1915-N3)-methyltransferase